MADHLDNIQRMRGYRDATRLLLSRMTALNNVLQGKLPRRERKELERKFEACNYALDLLSTHYWLLYGKSIND